ncbi:hypothetical protein FQA39_LY03640 [Lamprigera yunnana]|nr:hypothetical protein FQA39_LY03640 [Lamprigera yunnana]
MISSSVFKLLSNPLKNILSNMVMVRNYRPRRALLYVPGDNTRMINKAFTLPVDSIILDCEDGVAVNKKAEARTLIRAQLDQGVHIKSKKYDCGVRVNPVGSDLCEQDLNTILSAQFLPNSILLPKVEGTDDIRWFADKLNTKIEMNTTIDLIIYIESPTALLNCYDICKTATAVSTYGKFLLSAIVFGSDDFCAAIGATRTEDGRELLYVRQKIVLIAKAFGLQAIDRVHLYITDLEGLEKDCREGAIMGYTGKQVIHPNQIPIVQRQFLPTKAQLE